MKSFKKYRETKQTVVTLSETTVPDHLLHLSDNWDHHSQLSDETRNKMHDAMGGIGKSFTTFPLVGGQHHEVDADVADHLTKHGYQIKDYSKGIATIKKQVGDPSKGIPMREKMVDEKIGSVLDKTGAHDDIKKSFMNDPARAASKFTPGSTGHHVVITHSALGVSGMTTGTSWANQSCMDQGRTTEYNSHLADDSEHGTHVAYLVHHNDVGAMKHGQPENPIARIAIKPFHESPDDHNSDTIFRPENKTYGSGSSSFERAVGRWSTEKYPAKTDVGYSKNTHVYDDTGNTEYKSVSKDSVEKNIKANSQVVDAKGTAVDKDVIDHAISYGKQHLDTYAGAHKVKNTSDFVKNISSIGNLNTQHVAALHHMAASVSDGDGDRSSMYALAQEHGEKMSTGAINKHMYMFGSRITNRMMMNSKLPSQVVDSLDPSDYKHVRRSMLKSHHYDKVVDNYVDGKSGSFSTLGEHADHLTETHLHSLADMPLRNVSDISNIITKNKNFTQEHHDKLVKKIIDENPSNPTTKTLRSNLLTNSKFTSVGEAEHMSPYNGLSHLGENKHISPDTAIKIKDKYVGAASLGTDIHHGGTDGVPGFGRNPLSEQVSKHLTPQDHVKLAESGKDIHFPSVISASKHLNAIQHLVTHADKELGNHIETQTKHHEDNDLPEYDHTDEEDKHANNLVSKLHKHIENYARALENHIDTHVSSGGNEIIGNHDQHENVKTHLDHIDNLENYKTENNSSRYEGKDHFYDHIADIHDKMIKLEKNTENHENNDENF